ncbi:MAG: hypothetical protein JNK74_24175 [Candidatus Hydrogenedentes bacterium]|nr:hypothetical protein [Candidatus Hydrogenedentota bacterium]
MRALGCMVLVALLLDTLSVGAQTVGAEDAAPPRTEARNDDRITLKSGRVLRGVKIVRTTPFKLVLEVLPAVEPLEIPARQVVSVAYGERPSSEPQEARQEPAEKGDTSQVLQAVKVSPDLIKKLSAPLREKSVNFLRQDLLNTLRSAGILFGVPVTFGTRLEKLPVEERLVSVSLSEGASFEGFIRDTLAPELPWLKVEYRFDAVHFDRT